MRKTFNATGDALVGEARQAIKSAVEMSALPLKREVILYQCVSPLVYRIVGYLPHDLGAPIEVRRVSDNPQGRKPRAANWALIGI